MGVGLGRVTAGLAPRCPSLCCPQPHAPAAAASSLSLADSGRRDGVLWAAGLTGMVAATVTAYSLLLAGDDTYFYLCAGLILWGAYTGCTNPALEALFADSVRSGARSRIYATRFALQLGSAGVGPLLNMLAFWLLGNTWTLPELRLVFLVGLGLSLLPCLLLLFFTDDAALGEASEGLLAGGNSCKWGGGVRKREGGGRKGAPRSSPPSARRRWGNRITGRTKARSFLQTSPSTPILLGLKWRWRKVLALGLFRRGMASRPTVSVRGGGGADETVTLPAVLSAPIRPDVVHFVHTQMAK